MLILPDRNRMGERIADGVLARGVMGNPMVRLAPTEMEVSQVSQMDTSQSAGVTVLPANPPLGAQVFTGDFRYTQFDNPMIVKRNGERIMGLEEDLVLDIKGQAIVLTFKGGIVGWEIELKGGISFAGDKPDTIITL